MAEVKTVKISDKGQISIPKGIREEMNLKEGETLVMISDGEKIVLEKPEKFVKLRKSEGENTMLMSEHALKKDWDNKYLGRSKASSRSRKAMLFEDDERWNKY